INCELSDDGDRKVFDDGEVSGNNVIAPNGRILRGSDQPIRMQDIELVTLPWFVTSNSTYTSGASCDTTMGLRRGALLGTAIVTISAGSLKAPTALLPNGIVTITMAMKLTIKIRTLLELSRTTA